MKSPSLPHSRFETHVGNGPFLPAMNTVMMKLSFEIQDRNELIFLPLRSALMCLSGTAFWDALQQVRWLLISLSF